MSPSDSGTSSCEHTSCSAKISPPARTIATGVPVAVVRAEGEVFAIYDVCSHEEVPLSEGEVYDHTVECWLHGSCFDLRTGDPTGPPATKPVPVYPVKVEDGEVYVSLPAGAT